MPEELPYYVSGALAGIVPTPERVSGATLGQREKAVCKPLYELQYTRKYLTPAACSLQNRYILSLWRQARESRAEGGVPGGLPPVGSQSKRRPCESFLR